MKLQLNEKLNYIEMFFGLHHYQISWSYKAYVITVSTLILINLSQYVLFIQLQVDTDI